MKNLANPQIQKMKPYCPPLEGRRQYKGVLCDFNERTIPVSSKVRRALRDFVSQNKLQIYPEYGGLCAKIAEYARVPLECVMITNGSDQGIDLIFRTFTREGDAVVIPSPSFAMFYQCAEMVGNKKIEPAYRLPNLDYPFAEVMDAIENGAKLVVVCNPNNPTGTLIGLEKTETLLKKALTKGAIVYIDEAYFEFSGATAAGLIKKYPNLIITRTFSKAFGLPSLRIGYILSDARIIQELQKVRGPYDVNMAGFVASQAALADIKETKKYTTEVMKKAKPLVEEFFRGQKIEFYPSETNFILFKPKNPQRIYEELKANGILTRPRSGPNIDGTLRVTIGTVAQMKRFIKTFEKMLRKIAFLDRDGALIFEPQDTFQIDSVEKLRVLPGVVKGLKKLLKQGFKFAMISNQDGVGTPKFPRKDFGAPQKRFLRILRKNGIKFSEIFICPHLPEENCACRKPKTGLVDGFMRANDINVKQSFMYGDRETDRKFAENLGIRFIKAKTNGRFKLPLSS